MKICCDGSGLMAYALFSIFHWETPYQEWCGCDMCKEYLKKQKKDLR